MKAGAENRKKTIIAGALISTAVITFLWVLFTQIIPTFSSGPRPTPAAASTGSSGADTTTSAPTPEPVTPAPAKHTSAAKPNEPASAGVAATKLASTDASLDPTLDQSAMLRTEGLVYSGSGRNIFSANSYTQELAIPVAVKKVRPGPVLPPAPPQPPPPPPHLPSQLPAHPHQILRHRHPRQRTAPGLPARRRRRLPRQPGRHRGPQVQDRQHLGHQHPGRRSLQPQHPNPPPHHQLVRPARENLSTPRQPNKSPKPLSILTIYIFKTGPFRRYSFL